MDEIESKYVVIRIASGNVMRIHLFNTQEDALAKARYLYEKYSKSMEVPREFDRYYETCMLNGLKFEYPYDGSVYKDESIVVKKVEVETKAGKDKEDDEDSKD